MSKWFDNATTANKLRQSYLKGFLDISGGGLNIRTDNSMNFYFGTQSGVAETKSGFGMDASHIYYLDPSTGVRRDICNNSIHYLQNARGDLQSQIDTIVTGGGSVTLASANIVDLNTSGNAAVGGKLFVGSDASFAANVTVRKNLEVNGKLLVSGDAEFEKDLTVDRVTHLKGNVFMDQNLFLQGDKSNLWVGENAHIDNDLDVSGSLIVTNGDASFNHKLRVAQDASFGNNVDIKGTLRVKQLLIGDNANSGDSGITFDSALNVNDALYVQKNAVFDQKINVFGDVSMAKTLTVVGATTLGNTLSVALDATLKQKLAVWGDVSMGSNLRVVGAADISGAFHATGASQLDDTLAVTGATTLSNTLSVAQNATLKQKLAVWGDVSMGSNLRVVQAVDVSGAFHATGASQLDNTLAVTGATTLSSTLHVTGATTLYNTLSVAQDATLSSKLFVTSDASLNGKLYVDKDSKLNGKLDVNLDASFGSSILVGGLKMSPAHSTSFATGSNENAIIAQNGTKDINIVPGAAGTAFIRGDVWIDGSLNVRGDFTQINTTTTVTDSFLVKNAGTTDALKVVQTGGKAVATFNYMDGATEKTSLFVDYNGFVGVGNYNHNSLPGANLEVQGTFHTTSGITIDGSYSSENGNMTLANGNITLTHGNLTISDDSKTSSIAGKLNLGKDLTITAAGNIVLSGAAAGSGYINQW